MKELLTGYLKFKKQCRNTKEYSLRELHIQGQNPKAMIIACCDSRVDPALLLQCNPGDLFVIRNVANIIPPYEKDSLHHGTSAAIEFGIKILGIKNLIILGHSNCGGIKAWLENKNKGTNRNLEFINNWVSLIKIEDNQDFCLDEYSKRSLINSYNNCCTFPWIKEKLETKELNIHLWFFDIKTGNLSNYDHNKGVFKDIPE